VAYKLSLDKPGITGYVGKAERCTYEFRIPLPEQLGAQWAAERILDANERELAKEGCQLLRLRVWRDTAPTWHTDYKVEATATKGSPGWPLIIYGVLAVLALFFGYKIFQIGKEIVEELDLGSFLENLKDLAPWLIGGGLVILAIVLTARRGKSAKG